MGAGVVRQAQTTKQVKKKKEQHLQKMHASARELCKMAYFLFSKLHDKALYGPASSSGLFSPSSASPSRRRAIRCAMPRAACVRVCVCACAVAQYSFLWSWIIIACDRELSLSGPEVVTVRGRITIGSPATTSSLTIRLLRAPDVGTCPPTHHVVPPQLTLWRSTYFLPRLRSTLLLLLLLHSRSAGQGHPKGQQGLSVVLTVLCDQRGR